MKITKPGIYDGLPMAEYIADPCPGPSLSRGCIDTLVTCTPAHAYHEHPRLGGGERKESRAMDRGSAAHELLLGGETRIAWLDFNDYKTKEAKRQRDEARGDSRVPMLEKDREPIEDMVEIAAPFLTELGGEWLRGGPTCEQTVAWFDGDTWCKSRPDWLARHRHLVIDYKTTGLQGGPDKFERGMIGRANDIGAAWTLRGLDLIAGHQRHARAYVFAVQEAFAPYCCFAIACDDDMLQTGREKVAAGLDIWGRCMESGVWPGYPSALHYASTPTYETYNWDAKRVQLIAGGVTADIGIASRAEPIALTFDGVPLTP